MGFSEKSSRKVILRSQLPLQCFKSNPVVFLSGSSIFFHFYLSYTHVVYLPNEIVNALGKITHFLPGVTASGFKRRSGPAPRWRRWPGWPSWQHRPARGLRRARRCSQTPSCTSHVVHVVLREAQEETELRIVKQWPRSHDNKSCSQDSRPGHPAPPALPPGAPTSSSLATRSPRFGGGRIRLHHK